MVHRDLLSRLVDVDFFRGKGGDETRDGEEDVMFGIHLDVNFKPPRDGSHVFMTTQYGPLEVRVCRAEIELEGHGCIIPPRSQNFREVMADVARIVDQVMTAADEAAGAKRPWFSAARKLGQAIREGKGVLKGGECLDTEHRSARWVIEHSEWSPGTPGQVQVLKGRISTRDHMRKVLAKAHEDAAMRPNQPRHVVPKLRLVLYVDVAGDASDKACTRTRMTEDLSTNKKAMIAALFQKDEGNVIEGRPILREGETLSDD